MIEEIADEDARHEIAGQHEEDVDADERAVEPAQPGVERDNEVDGEGAQAVEVRAVGEARLEPVPVALGGRLRRGLRGRCGRRALEQRGGRARAGAPHFGRGAAYEGLVGLDGAHG